MSITESTVIEPKQKKKSQLININQMMELENHHCATSNLKHNSSNQMFAESIW